MHIFAANVSIIISMCAYYLWILVVAVVIVTVTATAGECYECRSQNLYYMDINRVISFIWFLMRLLLLLCHGFSYKVLYLSIWNSRISLQIFLILLVTNTNYTTQLTFELVIYVCTYVCIYVCVCASKY